MIEIIEGKTCEKKGYPQGIPLSCGMHPAVEVGEAEKTDSSGNKKEEAHHHKYHCDNCNDHLFNPLPEKVFRENQGAYEVQNRVNQRKIYKHVYPLIKKSDKN